MNELSLADVKVIINEAFEQWTPRIIDECTKNNTLFQAQCKANQIFSDKENVRDFFNTKDNFEHHVEMHKKKENETDKRQGFIVKILTSSVVVQALWNFFQWKHQ